MPGIGSVVSGTVNGFMMNACGHLVIAFIKAVIAFIKAWKRA